MADEKDKKIYRLTFSKSFSAAFSQLTKIVNTLMFLKGSKDQISSRFDRYISNVLVRGRIPISPRMGNQ